MAITKLQLYNIAAFAIGEEKFTDISEDRESRRAMDEVYDRGKGFVFAVLEQGHWNHGMRAVKVDASTSVTPAFGFTFAHDKPTDFVKLNMISADESFTEPLNQYEFEGDYIYTFVDPLYMRYVSNDALFGGDFSRWPDSFSEWAGTWLAKQIAPKSLSEPDYKDLLDKEKKLLRTARARDASMEPTRFVPLSTWARSRYGRTGTRRDRGSRGSLTG